MALLPRLPELVDMCLATRASSKVNPFHASSLAAKLFSGGQETSGGSNGAGTALKDNA
eukprot:CAMPEP_0172902560 /NCGR_PEP_ID=MMETSP1075-20121228/168654_1 /TAXON_ID=2916 /ORGANISM="Ceratium fusus, Strain PA161109" /LENGTH=57 /DNA_ID=CAMNT_0013759179 /DNA_START=95 /DNA_END=264 /DNA_ORIENTATION=-